MKFTNLRLVGFKSFVDQTDFDIREGLTGIVGPNGCGKSNILEALRWVMGATSAKALRGGGMADVIFAGTTMRPARNWAEVILTLDNSDRTAPAEYNETTTIEVSRRIINKEDGTQSIYRINNKEVRAKDVQLLFADASTGANSPALVRQGQISELINAKPQNRRRLLEEAAGITGLHTRRHEAELRLRAAEQNLERLDDVTGELESQKSALARQARQATRYRNISGDIRRAEAASAFLRWREAVDAKRAAEESLQEISSLIEDTARAAAAAATAQTNAHHALDPLRMAEAEAAAGLHRLQVAREGLEQEAARAQAELDRLNDEIGRLENDIERETALFNDANDAVETLVREEAGLKERTSAERNRIDAAEQRRRETQAAVEDAERHFDERNAQSADAEARRRAAQSALSDLERRRDRLTAQVQSLDDERASIALSEAQAQAFAEANAAFENARAAADAAEAAFTRAEDARAGAASKESALRAPRAEAEKTLSHIKAEMDALTKVLASEQDGDWPTLLEAVSATPGYENALAAALGDDLAAGLDEAAPAHWAPGGASAAADPLPQGAISLAEFVSAPAQLAGRLAAVGVVERDAGPALRAALKPGQRLVTREGDLWRWDGFAAHAEAKTAAAVRLEQRNRLSALEADRQTAEERVDEAVRLHESAAAALNEAQEAERGARHAAGAARQERDLARDQLSKLEREHERATNRLAAIADAIESAKNDLAEVERAREERETEAAGLPDAAALAQALAEARDAVAAARSEAGEARAAHNDLAREAESRERRMAEIVRERGVWSSRGETAQNRLEELKGRLKTAVDNRDKAQNAPQEIEAKSVSLLDAVAEAEQKRAAAADALAHAQSDAQSADKTAKDADQAASEAREARARFEAQAEAAVERVEEATLLARETCDAAPEALPVIAEFKDGEALPTREDIDAKLERYKRERENLGGVNLRADEELAEITERLEEIVVEREDCEGAIRKLRAAIGGLNREARQRLNDAFETVNANFSKLFTRLFNGGQAELRMIDSEDVLEAGLEIFASPPGKKLASMSLMSGGEQALTATALIFAVFMANPAPVCVLDEVDAPLDDANTERFCRLLHEMARETDTRFIAITHHALTMSRMDRLFGVTMVERGVSQLVSVDLRHAEQLAAAE